MAELIEVLTATGATLAFYAIDGGGAGEPDPDGHGSSRQRRRGQLQQVRVGRA